MGAVPTIAVPPCATPFSWCSAARTPGGGHGRHVPWRARPWCERRRRGRPSYRRPATSSGATARGTRCGRSRRTRRPRRERSVSGRSIAAFGVRSTAMLRPHVRLSRPRPYMGASELRTVLPSSFSVSAVTERIEQAQARLNARSRLTWQYRVAIASWDNGACPHASHTCTAASSSSCLDPADCTSNLVVIIIT